MAHIKSGDKVRKAVFPVAGMGSRFLPATKANPKEMMPVVDKPLIQYAVEEAVEAGITEMIFVNNKVKDGSYLLNLQIASFENDASPSKPILFEIKK